MQYLLLFHGNNDYTNAPVCYVHMYIACLSHSISVIDRQTYSEGECFVNCWYNPPLHPQFVLVRGTPFTVVVNI